MTNGARRDIFVLIIIEDVQKEMDPHRKEYAGYPWRQAPHVFTHQLCADTLAYEREVIIIYVGNILKPQNPVNFTVN